VRAPGARRRAACALVAIALIGAACVAPAHAAPVPLVNPGFESTRPGEGGSPEGWVAIQHAGEESYDFVLDSGQKKSGTQSMRIKRFGREPYGTITQVLPGSALAGRTVRLSAWIRTEDVPQGRRTGAGLVLMALRGSAFLAHEFMQKRRAQGSTDWTRYSIELALPPGTNRLEAGATLEGGGTMWVDDFELEVLDR